MSIKLSKGMETMQVVVSSYPDPTLAAYRRTPYKPEGRNLQASNFQSFVVVFFRFELAIGKGDRTILNRLVLKI